MKYLYTLFFYLPAFSIAAQENSTLPAIEVRSLEYIWEKDLNAAANEIPARIILMTDKINRERLKKSFTTAIANKWNVNVPDFDVSVKHLPVLANRPKFKIKLKNKDPRKTYMIIQIFDKCNYYYSPDGPGQTTALEIRYKLINGKNDSVAADKNLMVTVLRHPAPEGQMLLTRLPGFPSSFMNAFDSIATWTLDENVTGEKKILIDPACSYVDASSEQPVLNHLFFHKEDRSIKLLSEPGFSIYHHGPKTEETGKKKNLGGNSLGGAVTLLTGIGTNKTKTFSYTDDHLFNSGIHSYHSFVSYKEEQVKERDRVKNDDGSYSMTSTDYTTAGRYMDTSLPNLVTLGKDTLVSFRMKFNYSSVDYTQMWNGRDTATISVLPAGWLNEKHKEVSLNGEFHNKPFSMTSTNGSSVKKFMINGQPAATFYGSPAPAKASLFKELSENELVVMTILCMVSKEYMRFHWLEYHLRP